MSNEKDTGPSNLHDSADSSLDKSIIAANESQVSSLSLDENPELLNHSIGEENLGENSIPETEDTEDGVESRETEDNTANMAETAEATPKLKIYDKPPNMAKTGGAPLERYIFRLNNWKTIAERHKATPQEMYEDVLASIDDEHPLCDRFMTEAMKWKKDVDKKKEIEKDGIEVIIKWIRSWLGKSEITNTFKMFDNWINMVRDRKQDTLEFLNEWDTIMAKVEAIGENDREVFWDRMKTCFLLRAINLEEVQQSLVYEKAEMHATDKKIVERAAEAVRTYYSSGAIKQASKPEKVLLVENETDVDPDLMKKVTQVLIAKGWSGPGSSKGKKTGERGTGNHPSCPSYAKNRPNWKKCDACPCLCPDPKKWINKWCPCDTSRHGLNPERCPKRKEVPTHIVMGHGIGGSGAGETTAGSNPSAHQLSAQPPSHPATLPPPTQPTPFVAPLHNGLATDLIHPTFFILDDVTTACATGDPTPQGTDPEEPEQYGAERTGDQRQRPGVSTQADTIGETTGSVESVVKETNKENIPKMTPVTKKFIKELEAKKVARQAAKKTIKKTVKKNNKTKSYVKKKQAADKIAAHEVLKLHGNIDDLKRRHPAWAEASSSRAVVDTGAPQTLCGLNWYNRYKSKLPPAVLGQLKMDEAKDVFKFGGGEIRNSLGTVLLPAYLLDDCHQLHYVHLRTHVVQADLDLLIGASSMDDGEVDIQMRNGQGGNFPALIFNKAFPGMKFPMTREFGHKVIAIWPPTPEDDKRAAALMLNREWSQDAAQVAISYIIENANPQYHNVNGDLVLLSKEFKDSVKANKNFNRPLMQKDVIKLHHFYGHPSKQKLKGMLERAGWITDTVSAALNYIEENCMSCKVNKKRAELPRAAIPRAANFNQLLTLDLKFLSNENKLHENNKYVLYLIDAFTRYKRAILIKDKEAETIVEGILLGWIQIFGAPSAVHTDRGSEFLNRQFRSLCEKYQIRVTSTASFSPHQNGLNERNHAYVDFMVQKIQDADPSCKTRIALAWACNAANCLENRFGLTPAMLVFGTNATGAPPDSDPANPTSLESDWRISKKLQSHLQIIEKAREACIEAQANVAIKEALKQRLSHQKENCLVPGRWVYWKDSTQKRFRGPAKISYIDGKTVHVIEDKKIYTINSDQVLLQRTGYEALDPLLSLPPVPEDDELIDGKEIIGPGSETLEENSEDQRTTTKQNDDDGYRAFQRMIARLDDSTAVPAPVPAEVRNTSAATMNFHEPASAPAGDRDDPEVSILPNDVTTDTAKDDNNQGIGTSGDFRRLPETLVREPRRPLLLEEESQILSRGRQG